MNRYADAAPSLAFARVLDGEGAGARRQCGDHDGGRWTETCTLWEVSRAYAMQVDTDADDYPYPMTELRGEWRAEPVDGGTKLVMRFDYSMRGRWLGELLAAAWMLPGAERDATAVLESWERQLARPAHQRPTESVAA